MSGIAGIYNRDGTPIERPLLRALTDSLSYCGPDGREIWSDGPVGFGHAMSRTMEESLADRQPACLDGQLWITAEARLDCRSELEAGLKRSRRTFACPVADSELILRAYAVWGEDCVQHIQGDFAFAIWDSSRRQLFCARDHFGIKPFYYSELGSRFFFSNTLNCLRQYAEISERLNEAAIADFLLFGLNCDNATTAFRDIHRLPPAHFLVVSPEGMHIRRYWTAPTEGHIRYRRPEDYLEHFRILLEAAVADRLGAGNVGILLSGGLDSSSVASIASELRSGARDLHAFTVTYESLIPDRDRAYASVVAGFLQIPLRCLSMDHLKFFDGWDDPQWWLPEPVEDPFFAGVFHQFRVIAKECRVALSGEGNDNLMHFEMGPYAWNLARSQQWRRLLADAAHYLRVRPFPWLGVRRRLGSLLRRDGTPTEFPRWFAPDFVHRMNLVARWKEWSELPASLIKHPILPKGHASLSLPHWTHLFESENAGVTHFPVEVRYPFLDLRVVNYLLALPPFPWFFQKSLLRKVMAGKLPESVRVRPKTPLAGDPLLEKLKQPESDRLAQNRWSKEIEAYIDVSALRPLDEEGNSDRAALNIRPYCLNFWLQSARPVRYKLVAEAGNA